MSLFINESVRVYRKSVKNFLSEDEKKMTDDEFSRVIYIVTRSWTPVNLCFIGVTDFQNAEKLIR